MPLANPSTTRQQIQEAGRRRMAASSVAICGLARDCERSLSRLIPLIENLARSFRQHRIIVVENDSVDATGRVVEDWAAHNRNVEAIRFCYCADRFENPTGGTAGWFGSRRMARMAFARNRYLDAVTAPPLPDWMILIDLDIHSFSMEGVQHSFGLLDDWDVIAGNGRRYSLRHPFRPSVYWDSYAYERGGGFPGGVQTPELIRADQVEIPRLLSSGRPLPAHCAFGGLCIYRAEVLGKHAYSVVMNTHPEVPVLCDHPTLIRSIRAERPGLRLAINPEMKVCYASVPALLGQFVSKLFPR